MGFKICTLVLAAGEEFTIVESMNCINVTYQMSGTTGDIGTVEGDYKVSDSEGNLYPSVPQTLGPGGGNNISSPAGKPIDGVTLACSVGSMNITLGF